MKLLYKKVKDEKDIDQTYTTAYTVNVIILNLNHMKKTVRLLHIGLHQMEDTIITLMNKKGQNVAEIVRGLIRDYGERTFPPTPLYVQIQKERLELKKETIKDIVNFKKMAPEEYAERVLGARISHNRAWLSSVSGQPYPIPLNVVKDWTTDMELVQNHLNILKDEDFFPALWNYAMGKEERAEAIRQWQEV